MVMHEPPLRIRFAELVTGEEHAIDLGEAALLVAGHEYPSLDVAHWMERLDCMADLLRTDVEELPGEVSRLEALVSFLYQDFGLRGNRDDYYDPRNSFLNDVLERRLGIPITLGVLCIEIGRRVGIPLRGVGFPTHFLVTSAVRPDLFLDPFDGRLMRERGCRQLLAERTGGSLQFEPRFLEAVGSREILQRLLNNLKVIYLQNEDAGRTLAILDRLLDLDPENLDDVRSRGLLRLTLGEHDEAVIDLERYLSGAHTAEDRGAIEHCILHARRCGVIVN